MVAEHARPTPGRIEAERLARVADMVTNAVELLQQAMAEIKSERGNGDDDGDAARTPDRDAE